MGTLRGVFWTCWGALSISSALSARVAGPSQPGPPQVTERIREITGGSERDIKFVRGTLVSKIHLDVEELSRIFDRIYSE